MFRWRGSSQKQEQKHHENKPEDKLSELKAALGPLTGRNLLYCTDECLKRYLEARNWNVDKAKKMLEETLLWRSTYKPEEIRWEEVAVEGETGKMFRGNFHDRHGRTILIMKPGLQNTTSLDSQIKHLVYMMENAILNLPQGQEEIEFGGKTTMKYDHEAFSKLMVQDDVKGAKYWGFDEKTSPVVTNNATNGNHATGAIIAPEPEFVG